MYLDGKYDDHIYTILMIKTVVNNVKVGDFSHSTKPPTKLCNKNRQKDRTELPKSAECRHKHVHACFGLLYRSSIAVGEGGWGEGLRIWKWRKSWMELIKHATSGLCTRLCDPTRPKYEYVKWDEIISLHLRVRVVQTLMYFYWKLVRNYSYRENILNAFNFKNGPRCLSFTFSYKKKQIFLSFSPF